MKLISLEKAVVALTTIVSFAALYFSYTAGYILTYNDAASHLNIARRVIDSLTPGFAQIGTVWLPLPHILMLTFTWNDFLWHSGLAGSFVSMAAYIFGVYFMYKLLFLLTESISASSIGALILGLNPNLLYLQTTPMTEPLLITSIIVSVYFLAKYLKENTIKDLILCGAFVSASTLIRYDGWFLFICLSLMVPIFLFFKFGRKKAEGATILFLGAGGLGIFLWFLWNLAIFGDALYFITGPYSAAAQQKVLKSVGQLPTQGDLYISSLYYMWSVINNNGVFLTISAVIGAFLIPFALKKKSQFITILAISSPILFNIIALYFGQSAMNVPQAPRDPGLFNIRYGVMALPAIAVILGILSSNKYLRIIVVVLLFIQSVYFVKQGIPVSLADGIKGLKNTMYTVKSSKWLAQNYQGGLILTSLASHDAFVARTGLSMKYYVHEGTRDYWHNALKNPNEDVQYIALLSFPPDSVYRALKDNQNFKNNYEMVHNYGTFEIYKRKN